MMLVKVGRLHSTAADVDAWRSPGVVGVVVSIGTEAQELTAAQAIDAGQALLGAAALAESGYGCDLDA